MESKKQENTDQDEVSPRQRVTDKVRSVSRDMQDKVLEAKNSLVNRWNRIFGGNRFLDPEALKGYVGDRWWNIGKVVLQMVLVIMVGVCATFSSDIEQALTSANKQIVDLVGTLPEEARLGALGLAFVVSAIYVGYKMSMSRGGNFSSFDSGWQNLKGRLLWADNRTKSAKARHRVSQQDFEISREPNNKKDDGKKKPTNSLALAKKSNKTTAESQTTKDSSPKTETNKKEKDSSPKTETNKKEKDSSPKTETNKNEKDSSPKTETKKQKDSSPKTQTNKKGSSPSDQSDKN